MKFSSFFPKTPVTYISLLFVVPFLLTIMVEKLEAVEPDARLFAEHTAERNAAYSSIGQKLTENIRTSTDEQEKQGFLVQQQLLKKLEELPDKPEKPVIDLHVAEQNPETTLSWQEIEQYLERYTIVLQEGKTSGQQLESIENQMQTMNNRLLALAEQDPAQDILQLQYAFQVRKFAQQTEIEKQLREGMEKAQKQYPAILERCHIDQQMIDDQERREAQIREKLRGLEDEKILAAAGDDILIEQQESLLAGYLGRDLSDNEKKEMHYGKLKLLKLQVQQLIKDDRILEEGITLLEEAQKTIWFHLLGEKPNFFKLVKSSGDINKQIVRLRKKTDKAHSRIYRSEKQLSTLRGGNALVGPMAMDLIATLDDKVKTVFNQLSGIEQRAEILENKGRLLDRAIDLQQSVIGSMVTKIREATGHIFERVMEVLQHPLLSYSGMSLSLLLILQILVLLIFGIIVNRLYGHMVARMGRKRNWSEQTVHLIQAVGKYPFIFIVAMIMLSVVGINTRSLALVAGALSVGIGFGMQTIVNNLVSGIILLFDKSIRPGDFICLGENSPAGGFRGSVVQMNTRATVLRTNDNINIIIPNADLMASQVVNWTYADEKIRFRIPFSVAYGTDIDKVKTLIAEALLELPVVLSQPEPQIWLASHAESWLAFLAAIWVEGPDARQPARINDIALTAITKTLARNGIEIPCPQLDLRLRDNDRQSINFMNISDPLRPVMHPTAVPQ